MGAPGFPLQDHGAWRVRLPVDAADGDLSQPPLSDCGVMVGEQVELRYAQKASVAAGGVGDAGGPEIRMRKEDLGVGLTHDTHRQSAVGRNFPGVSLRLNPV